jgi:hypothetical protein
MQISVLIQVSLADLPRGFAQSLQTYLEYIFTEETRHRCHDQKNYNVYKNFLSVDIALKI